MQPPYTVNNTDNNSGLVYASPVSGSVLSTACFAVYWSSGSLKFIEVVSSVVISFVPRSF